MPPVQSEASLRPVGAEDMTFLLRVYSSTRSDIANIPWTAEQKRQFLEMQFGAQHKYYHDQFPDADYLVVELAGEAIGRLYVNRTPDEIHILDIAILPEKRGCGVGSHLLYDLLDEGRRARKHVSLYVELENSARNLYQRLGFTAVKEHGVYLLMKWTPEPT